MSDSVQPIPPGMENLIPHLVCSPCTEAIEFYKKAFGAEEMHRMIAPDGKRMSINVEHVGNLMVQHYVEDIAERGNFPHGRDTRYCRSRICSHGGHTRGGRYPMRSLAAG